MELTTLRRTLGSLHPSDRSLHRNERGMVYVFVALGLLAFLAASMLAIDVGMLMTARAQAQNAADAGAHAGAVALVYNSYTDRSTNGPAVQAALSAARANPVMGQLISISPGDVTFPNDRSGNPNWVHVQVYRTAARSNAVTNMIATYFGAPTTDIVASATGEAAPVNAETCVKPWTIPDRWQENKNPPWTQNSQFDGSKPNPDVYIPPDQPGYTGFSADRDRGLELVLKAGTGTEIAPSFYYCLALPGGRGGSWYRTNIATCNTTLMHIGDDLTAEPGNKVGPTKQGVDDLVSQDPSAYWDTSCNCVKGSAFAVSPRVVVIPLFDPVYYWTGKQNSRNASLRAVNFMGFFVEGQDGGGSVTGRITPVTGLIDRNAGPAPAAAFPRAIRLVQ